MDNDKLKYQVMREKGTEPPFSGQYYATKDQGVYKCASCGAPLFSSDTKFDSGTGWPSFTEPMVKENIELRSDGDRTEVVCRHCGSHLGHVFNDGPTVMPDGAKASGQRYCINSVCLDLEKK